MQNVADFVVNGQSVRLSAPQVQKVFEAYEARCTALGKLIEETSSDWEKLAWCLARSGIHMSRKLDLAILAAVLGWGVATALVISRVMLVLNGGTL